ncbi:hypothetical protein CcaverHIS641_0605930 [Cutaneotrichosporon cavernicola]|nr:hypothetical protein CcaverHIS641_0605930 [Cutaneotrichosporon cavernicola]
MPTFGIDQGDIEWDVPAHAWAAPNYCAAAPVPRTYCIYCHARIGRQRNVYSTDDPNLCTFFAAYFRAPTTGAARAILERDVLRRNHGLRELPPPPLPTQPCEWVTLDMETWFCKWCRYAHQANEMPRELAAAVPMRYTSPVPRPESLLRRWIAMVAPGSFE